MRWGGEGSGEDGERSGGSLERDGKMAGGVAGG